MEGASKFAAELREARKALPKEMAKAEREIAQSVAKEARLFAIGTGHQQGHFASKIVGGADKRGGFVRLRGGVAAGAFWGAKPRKRTGWNAGWRKGQKLPRRNLGGQPQFRRWVGNSWAPGEPNQGPYAINPAIEHSRRLIDARSQQALTAAVSKAYPEGR